MAYVCGRVHVGVCLWACAYERVYVRVRIRGRVQVSVGMWACSCKRVHVCMWTCACGRVHACEGRRLLFAFIGCARVVDDFEKARVSISTDLEKHGMRGGPHFGTPDGQLHASAMAVPARACGCACKRVSMHMRSGRGGPCWLRRAGGGGGGGGAGRQRRG